MQKKINNQFYIYINIYYLYLYTKKTYENERRVIDNDADDEENAVAAANINAVIQ